MQPDVTLMDLRMPNMSGIEAISGIPSTRHRMLNLTRRPGQSIIVGDDVAITMHGVRQNQIPFRCDGAALPYTVKRFTDVFAQRVARTWKSCREEKETGTEKKTSD
jgi:sRNA-binding carbon storage regulator CsrA